MERSLEVREVKTGRAATAVELLSPAHKLKGEGRQQYLAKHQRILNSTVHLVEIDLLRVRAGEPMPSAGWRARSGLSDFGESDECSSDSGALSV